MITPSHVLGGLAAMAVSLGLSACGGSTPHSPHDVAPPPGPDGFGPSSMDVGAPAGALLVRTATASPVDLSGRWTVMPAFSVDPVLVPDDRSRRGSAAAGNPAGFAGRRGRFSGAGGFGGGGRAGGRGGRRPVGGRPPRERTADETSANLGDATLIGAQAFTISMTDSVATIARDDAPLVDRRQFWDGPQLVVVRKVGRRLIVERYTLSPERTRLHVAIQIPRPNGDPSTFIRQFERATDARGPVSRTPPSASPSE